MGPGVNVNPEVKVKGCRKIALAPCEEVRPIDLCPQKGPSSVSRLKDLKKKCRQNKLSVFTSITKLRENKYTQAAPMGMGGKLSV